VEKFIDTPVKRYSSGMYVRLAFAVAAHLEPDILVIDEVLAVGDYAFQQKCLNKMHDVSTQGRTVLFVSHNMGAINRLCTRAILLDQGRILTMGPTSEVSQQYMAQGGAGDTVFAQAHNPEKPMNLRRVAMRTTDGEERTSIGYHEAFKVIVEYEVNQAISSAVVAIGIFTFDGTCAFLSADFDAEKAALGTRAVGYYRAEIDIPGKWLNVGRYSISVYISADRGERVFDRRETLIFDIGDTGTPGSMHGINRQGVLQPVLNWETTRLHDN
jgi:lipopolysaccharide transport system ATP-binding protein